MEIVRYVSRILALPLVGLIVIYQKTISPDHGFVSILHPYGFCKFHPTCSEYARLALIRDGVISLPKIIFRIIKCRPSAQRMVDHP